jgi:hypothetical protein
VTDSSESQQHACMWLNIPDFRQSRRHALVTRAVLAQGTSTRIRKKSPGTCTRDSSSACTSHVHLHTPAQQHAVVMETSCSSGVCCGHCRALCAGRSTRVDTVARGTVCGRDGRRTRGRERNCPRPHCERRHCVCHGSVVASASRSCCCAWWLQV